MNKPWAGTPQKVLRKAHELGAHTDCVVAGFDNACDDCVTVLQKAFHVFYHDMTVFEVLQAVLDDIYDER